MNTVFKNGELIRRSIAMIELKLFLVLASCLVFAALAGAASAATITRVGTGESPHVAMNSSGQFAVSWSAAANPPMRLIAGEAGAPLPAALTLQSQFAGSPDAAITPDGTRIVRWLDPAPGTPPGDELESVYPTGPVFATFGTASDPPLITQLPGLGKLYDETPAKLAVGADNSAMQVWTVPTRPTSRIVATLRRPGGEFQPVQTVYSASSKAFLSNPEGAISSSGMPTVIWNSNYGVLFADGNADGGFNAATRVPGSNHCHKTAFDQNASGGAALLMRCYTETGGTFRYSTRLPGNKFSRAKLLRSTAADFSSPTPFDAALALPDGRAVFAWVSETARSYDLQFVEGVTGVIGGKFGRTRTLTKPVIVSLAVDKPPKWPPYPHLFVGPGGRAYLATRMRNEKNMRIGAIRPNFRVTTTAVIGPATQVADVAFSESGAGVAILYKLGNRAAVISVSQFEAPAN